MLSFRASSSSAAHWAGVAVEGVGGHSADRAPDKRERAVPMDRGLYHGP